ncbi:nucleic acid-binding, OB-fold, replication protein A, OB domain protein [Tanacetum coccineum]
MMNFNLKFEFVVILSVSYPVFMAGTSNLVPELTPVKAGTSNLLLTLTPFKDGLAYQTTRVKKCDDFSGPVYGFNFKPFTDLLQEKKDSTFAYEEKGGKLKRFIRIEMQDTMGNKLQNVTLWGAYADQLDEYMGDRSALGHVLIIQFAKHKIYRGGITLKMYSSMLLKNLGGEASDHQIVPLVKYDRYDVRQDFLLQKVNLADIRDIAEIKSDVVVATIKVIERDNKWYYLPCGSCNRIVDEKTVDKKDSDSGELKKQVVLVCSNKECGEVTNVCYKVASKLLNRTAEEFIREMRKHFSNSEQPLSSFSHTTMGKLKGALSGPEES